jgi:hypothetical protein
VGERGVNLVLLDRGRDGLHNGAKMARFGAVLRELLVFLRNSCHFFLVEYNAFLVYVKYEGGRAGVCIQDVNLVPFDRA